MYHPTCTNKTKQLEQGNDPHKGMYGSESKTMWLVVPFVCPLLICSHIEDVGGGYTNIRNTEAAVQGRQYGPRPSIQPEKRSFEGCIDGFGPY